jgi:biopolymer transport protein ExbB/TolQ
METNNDPLQHRGIVAAVSVLLAVGAIGMMSLLPAQAALILLDKGSEHFPFPFTVQNAMWIAMFVGFGECFIRFRAIGDADAQFEENYLQLGKRFLGDADVGAIHARTKPLANSSTYLPRLIYRTAQSLLMTKSVDSATANINSNVDLYANSIDLRYTVLRYLTWFIPTLGFLGTCIGISLALNFAGTADLQDPNLLSRLSGNLGIAFYTNFLALLLSAILVLLTNLLQAREEQVLNVSAQYCLDNLINRYKEEE